MSIFNTEANSKINSLGSELKNKIVNGEHHLERLAHETGEKVGNMASDFASTTADSVKAGKEYVQEHPLKGIAIAAAAGLVTGSLLTMAMSSRRN